MEMSLLGLVLILALVADVGFMAVGKLSYIVGGFIAVILIIFMLSVFKIIS